MSFLKSMIPTSLNCPYCEPKNAYKTAYHFSNHLKNKHSDMPQPVSSLKEDLVTFLQETKVQNLGINRCPNREKIDLSTKTSKKLQCPYCSKTYKMEYHFKNHISRTHPEAINKLDSSHVSLVNSYSNIGLITSDGNIRITKLGYSCPECSKSYKTEFHYKNHIANKHQKIVQRSDFSSNHRLVEENESSAENSYTINGGENDLASEITKKFDTFNASFILLIGEIKELKINVIELQKKVSELKK